MDYTPYLYLGAIPAVLIGQIYFLGVRMSNPEKMIKPRPGGLGDSEKAFIASYDPWLAAERLQFRTAFRFGAINVAVYQQENQPRYFSFLFHQRVTFSAESYLEDLTILDTSNSGSLGLFPRPGAYAQSFPGISAEELWKRHLEGESHLTMRFGYHFEPLGRSYEDLVIPAMRLRLQYNRTQFLWPVRVLYRFFVTRYTIRHKTIAQQFS
jgi:hypothetical protein